MLFMSKTSTAPRPALAIASRVRPRRYSCRRRKSTRSSQSTFIRPGAGREAIGNSAMGMYVLCWRGFAPSIGCARLRSLVKAVGDLPVIGLELEVGAPGFQLEQAREIDVAQVVADQADDDLMHERRHRHRNIELAPGVEPKLEILAQQPAREGRCEIEVDEGRGLVTAEGGAHDLSLEKLEVVGPGDAAAFGQHGGLGH